MSFNDLMSNSCVWFDGEVRRNTQVSIVSGILFFIGWWIIIDVQATNSEYFHIAYHLCGVFGTISLIMVNVVSNDQLFGATYIQGSRSFIFVGFLIGFASLISACWILFGNYVANHEVDGKVKPYWPGVGIFLQNVLIFLSSMIFRCGRENDQW